MFELCSSRESIHVKIFGYYLSTPPPSPPSPTPATLANCGQMNAQLRQSTYQMTKRIKHTVNKQLWCR